MKNNYLKISIITVCFNSEVFIERTVQSVIGQNYPLIEYIIIDGGSTDLTLDIIRKYQSKIFVLISEKDNGIYDAMNKGLANVTGDLVYFLNSGDYLSHERVIGDIVENIHKYPDYGIYIGDIMYYDEESTERLSGYRKNLTDVIARVINHQSIIARMDVFVRFGNFDTQYKIYADYDWLLRAVVKNGVSFKYIGIPFAYYLKAGKSDRLWKKFLPERREILKKYATSSQLIQYVIHYPGDGLRYIANRLMGLFSPDS